MLERRQPVLYEWEGEIPTRDIPTDVLYDVRLELVHDGDARAIPILRERLASFGAVRLRRPPFVAPRIEVSGPRYQLRLRVKDDQVDVRFDKRVKGRALSHVVEALAGLPGAKDLQIHAMSPQFDPAYSDVKPCTPCAAKRLPATRRKA